MSNITVLILEDHALSRAALVKMITAMGYTVIGDTVDAERCIELFIRHKPDIVIVDIALIKGRMNGVEAVKIMMGIAPRGLFIYITGYLNEYFDAIKTTKAAAVFSKPYNEKDLHIAIELALPQKIEGELPEESENGTILLAGSMYLTGDHLWIKQHTRERDGFFKYAPEEVMYFKANNVYVEVYVKGRNTPLVVTLSISKLADALKSGQSYYCFVKIGRSSIVNLQHIQGFSTTFDNLTMCDGTTVSVSESHRAEVKNYFQPK